MWSKLPVALALVMTFALVASAADPWLRPKDVPQPADNALSAARVDLGRALFFDPRLSGSNKLSCATCHDPDKGWSDGLKTAVGEGGVVLPRSTPTILNTAYQEVLMWDGRFATLEQQALMPLTNEHEMNQPLPRLIAELRAVPGYTRLFEWAYPGEGISEATIAKALASFQRTVVSTESPFDRWRTGDKDAMSESARRGFDVFRAKGNCAICHQGFNFTDDAFHNIGVKDLGPEPDMGRYAITKDPKDMGAFKTPTLRDVALTAPYMRNGMYATLEEVIDHYDRGGDTKAPNLSPNVRPLMLSAQEKADLAEFLRALTSKQVRFERPAVP